MKDLIVATKNEKKLHELKRYLKGVRANIISIKDMRRSPRIVEDGRTFKANAIKKAQVISKFTKGLTLADDSGLAVMALDGEPGVRSSRFAGPAKSDRQNNKKLLKLLEKVPPARRQARNRRSGSGLGRGAESPLTMQAAREL